MNTGVPPSGSGHTPEGGAASCTASPAKPSVPNAVQELRDNADALQQWVRSFDEHVREANDPLFGSGYPLEARVADLFQVCGRLSASIGMGLRSAASAIEAASAGETTQIGSTEGESATRKGDAQ